MTKYLFKQNFRTNLLRDDLIKDKAKLFGMTPKYLGDVLAGRSSCSRKVAILMTVNINPNAEVEDFFTEV